MMGGGISEGVTPQKYLLLVQNNALVPANRKIAATASSLEELEAILQSELGLPQPIGVCLADPATGGWVQCPSVEQMPAKAKVQVNPLQPRGPSAADVASAELQMKEMTLALQERKAQEDLRMQQEKMQMEAKAFEVQKLQQQVEAARAAKAASSAAEAKAASGPGREYVFLVQKNELVGTAQKVTLKAPTLNQLEAKLQEQLNVTIDIGIFVSGAQVMSIEALPLKGKIEVRKREAQVVQVAAPSGKEFKLLIVDSGMCDTKTKVKVTANSMDELEDAISAKLPHLENFQICPWDEDFEEFVEGIKWKHLPQTGRVELREKPDIIAADQVQSMMEAMEERMASAMADQEQKMLEMEKKAKEQELELQRKEKEAEERIKNMQAGLEAKTEDAAAAMRAETDAAVQQAKDEAAARMAEAVKMSEAAAIEAEEIAKAKAEEEAAEELKESVGGEASAEAAVEKLMVWVNQDGGISKDGDKEVAELLDKFASATHEDVVAAHKKLTAYRKSERERRKREFFASKRAKEKEAKAEPTPIPTADAGGAAGGAGAGASSKEGDREAKKQEQFEAKQAKAKEFAAEAMASGDRAKIEEAIAAAQPYAEPPGNMADDIEQLKQKLIEAVRSELEAGLKTESVDKLNNLVTLGKRFGEEGLASQLEARKEELVKVKRMLAGAKRATDDQQIADAVATARKLGVYEKQCRELEGKGGELQAVKDAEKLIRRVVAEEEEGELDEALAACEEFPQLQAPSPRPLSFLPARVSMR